MADLGVEPKRGLLKLSKGGDFEWNYDLRIDGSYADYESGAKVELRVGSETHDFTISGHNAYLMIPAEDADRIPDRCGFSVIMTMPLKKVLVVGRVKRTDPDEC